MVALEKELPAGETAAGAPSADAIPLRLRRRGASPRQALAAVAIGTLVLAALASHDLSSWLNRMGDAPLMMPLQRAAARWDHAMTRIGLARPAEALRHAMHRFLEAEW